MSEKKGIIIKRVIIDDKYFIDIDEHNYMLRSDLTIDKSGRERYIHLGYFSNMDSLLNKLIKTIMRNNLKVKGTLEEMKQILDETKEYVRITCTRLGL